jgi:hypothetical protein
MAEVLFALLWFVIPLVHRLRHQHLAIHPDPDLAVTSRRR